MLCIYSAPQSVGSLRRDFIDQSEVVVESCDSLVTQEHFSSLEESCPAPHNIIAQPPIQVIRCVCVCMCVCVCVCVCVHCYSTCWIMTWLQLTKTAANCSYTPFCANPQICQVMENCTSRLCHPLTFHHQSGGGEGMAVSASSSGPHVQVSQPHSQPPPSRHYFEAVRKNLCNCETESGGDLRMNLCPTLTTC